jgi:nucleoside-diphosphate-sugar epimerase
MWRLDGAAAIIRHVVDMRDETAVRQVVTSVRPTIVYSLASHGAYPHQTDARRIFETNVLGLTNLLQACDQIDYRLLVHTGSSSEYGRKHEPLREDHELLPESVYGVAKAAQSLLCQHWARAGGRPIVVFRLFSVYGPFEEPSRLIPRLIMSVLDDRPIAMASPRTSRDFVYVDDVVEALLQIDELERASGAIVNLGTGVQTTLSEMVQTLGEIAGRPIRAEWHAMPDRPWDTDVWQADTLRLRQTIFWSPTTVETGLERSLAWFRSNRRYYEAAT